MKPRTFDLGKVSLGRNQSLLYPLAPPETNAKVEDSAAFDPQYHPRHPTRGLAVFNRTTQALPGGTLTLLADRDFLLRTELPELPPASVETPLDRPGVVRFPNSLEEDVAVCETSIRRGSLCRAHQICHGLLSYSVARREIEILRRAQGAATKWLVIMRPAEQGWRSLTRAVMIGQSSSPQNVVVTQDSADANHQTIHLKSGDLAVLRALRFFPGDRIGGLVSTVIDLRERINTLWWSRQQIEAQIAANCRCQCVCQCTVVQKCSFAPRLKGRCGHQAVVVACGHIVQCGHRAECDRLRGQLAEIDRQLALLWGQIDLILADPALCPPKCNCDIVVKR